MAVIMILLKVCLVVLAVCQVGLSATGLFDGVAWWQKCDLLEMTHELSPDTMTYPLKTYTDNAFKLKRKAKGMYPGPPGAKPIYLHFNSFCMMEHLGTHIYSPNHVLRTMQQGRTRHTIDKVSLDNLIGEACVVDIPEEHKFKRSDYRLTVEDMHQWETTHGRFHKDCIVVVRSGQGVYYGDTNQYLGSDTPSHLEAESKFPDTLHWPAMGAEAAAWLVKERGLRAIGQDAISFDAGNTIDFQNSVHTVILGANLPGIENLKNVEKLPNRGATIIALPLRLKDGSGSPARVFAYGWMPDDPCRVVVNSGNGLRLSLEICLLAVCQIIVNWL